MFIKAIETASAFTRSIHTISRTFNSNLIHPGTATLFFVNEDGYAVTCKHVAEMLIQAEKINTHYQLFLKEKEKIKTNNPDDSILKELEKKYQLNADATIQLKTNFVNCVDIISGFNIQLHPTLDLAIIKFNGYNKVHYNTYARFPKDTSIIKQGKFLCRLGFPFPEFSNFKINELTNDIEWTNEGKNISPSFPIEGMITRFLGDDANGIFGIEMSTPGLRGQSGGPLFDENGIVYGMQSSTKHLHLGFDLEDKEIIINNQTKKISDYSFIHLGQCIHADIIKAFLKHHHVSFYEE